MTRQDKIKFIIEQEKLANNSWKWIKKAIKQVEELKEDLYDNQVKIKELCKEGDKLESKIKKLKALSSDIRLLTN